MFLYMEIDASSKLFIQSLRAFRRANSYGDDFVDCVDFDELFVHFFKQICMIFMIFLLQNLSKGL